MDPTQRFCLPRPNKLQTENIFFYKTKKKKIFEQKTSLAARNCMTFLNSMMTISVQKLRVESGSGSGYQTLMFSHMQTIDWIWQHTLNPDPVTLIRDNR